MTTRYEAAMYYVNELNLSVIPITKGKKNPAIPWKEYQERKPHQTELVDWFHQADYQIGIVCGAVSGGLTVLDFETPQAYEGWAERHPVLAAATRTVETGKGIHVYLRLPETRGNQKLIPGLVETRGEGGMVLAPPSLHPAGRYYRLKGEVRGIINTTWEDVSRGEKWEKSKQRVSIPQAAETIAFGAERGIRNNSVFNAAVVLRDSGAPQSQAVSVLLNANEKNDPPLNTAEIKQAVKSAYSRPARNRSEKIVSATLAETMKKITGLREEQAKGWLAMASTPGTPEKTFTAKTRQVFYEAGALNEIQIQEVLDLVMKKPPLAPRQATSLLRVWRQAHKRFRDAIAGRATDDEIARAFEAEYADRRMYTRGRWYQWMPTGVWTDGADVIDEIWQMMCEFKKVDIKPSSHKRRSIEECMQGTSLLGVSEEQIDAHPDWLNLLNGVFSFTTGDVTPHNPGQYLTTQLPFEHDGEATCPRWEKFISEVLVMKDGEADEKMCRFMQQAFGYSLTTWTKYETSFWLQGNGANGKSTLIHILSTLTGSASMALNLGMLERDQYQLALLPGIRVVTCTESPVGMMVADSMIKSLVSGDILSVRLPYGKPFQLIPQCKIWWAMNNYPRVADTSEGFWRKVKVIPFRASFNGAGRDEDLREKLENELPGIFNWALEGLHSLIRDGWAVARSIEEATNTYRLSNDIEQAFVEECCWVGDGYQVGARLLYKTYKDWCWETGHKAKTMTRVAGDWLRLGFEKERVTIGMIYRGIGVESKEAKPS